MMTIIERAELFATAAHGATGQKRKYTDEPYVIHLREVALLVAEHGGDDAMIAAAWLHDVVEDTAITLDEITAHFGEDVASLVFALTDVSRPRTATGQSARNSTAVTWHKRRPAP